MRCPRSTWWNCWTLRSAMLRSRVWGRNSKIQDCGGIMANSMVTVPTVKVEGTHGVSEAEILTPQAIEFLGALSANFEAERQKLLAARVTRGEALRQGKLYDFLPETASVRQGDWRVAPIPADLQDRRTEIT